MREVCGGASGRGLQPGHAVHALQGVDGDPSASDVPTTQSTHAVAPPLLYWPTTQSTQGVDALESVSAFPGAHTEHDVAEAPEYVPGAHASHAVAGFES